LIFSSADHSPSSQLIIDSCGL